VAAGDPGGRADAGASPPWLGVLGMESSAHRTPDSWAAPRQGLTPLSSTRDGKATPTPTPPGLSPQRQHSHDAEIQEK